LNPTTEATSSTSTLPPPPPPTTAKLPESNQNNEVKDAKSTTTKETSEADSQSKPDSLPTVSPTSDITSTTTTSTDKTSSPPLSSSTTPTPPTTTSSSSSSSSSTQWQINAQTKLPDIELANWEFDAFKACNVDPLKFGTDLTSPGAISGVPYAMQMFMDQGLIRDLSLDSDALRRYLCRIEREYNQNPYHNRVHALDVMQTCHCVLVQSPSLTDHMDAAEKFALLLGAYVHDVGHPGVNNNLLVTLANQNTKERKRGDLAAIAMRYNNISVLESYHIATAFEFAFDDLEENANPFLSLDQETFVRVKALMVELVLATDMQHHSALLSELKQISSTTNEGKARASFSSSSEDEDSIVEVTDDPHWPQSNVVDAEHARHVGEIEQTNQTEHENNEWDLSDVKVRTSLLKGVIHGCDISNVGKKTEATLGWMHVLMEEFWRQGELEIELGYTPALNLQRLDVTTPQGRSTNSENQKNFVKFFVKPLHQILATQLNVFNSALEWMEENGRHHERLIINHEAAAV